MKEIVITGASGFVGVNLVKDLQNTYKISPLSIRYNHNQHLTLRGDAIIHLAGKAHDLKSVSVPSDYYEANFELTKQLFDAFLVSDLSVFIFMSTVKAVADQVTYKLTEDEFPNPLTHYGISKHKAEAYIMSKVLPDGKRIYILRPCMIHGPGNKGNLNLLYEFVSKGLPWPLGAFENQRSFLSIGNLCFVIQQLLAKDYIPSGIYNVADNGSLSINEIMNLLSVSLKRKIKIWNIPPSLIKKTAKLGDYFHLPLNTDRLQKMTESYLVSNDKITKAIGEPLPVKMEEGLLFTFKSF